MRIAVLGMGRMGQAVTGRLLGGGHEVVIWNRTPGKAPSLVDRGAVEAGSVAAAVTGVELVVTSLATDDAVREVALGDGGIRALLQGGVVYADASTVSPTLTHELYDAFGQYVAMPILGSPAVVESGHAVFLIGGDEEAMAAVEPIFPAVTATVRRYDAPWLAIAAKLAVNLLLLDSVVALSEAFAVGRSGGLSDQQLRDLFEENSMVAPGIKNRFEAILTGEREPWWGAALGAKDAGLAIGLAEASGGHLPATAAVQALYLRTAAETDGDDIADVAQLYEL